jgi:hypothetical protein
VTLWANDAIMRTLECAAFWEGSQNEVSYTQWEGGGRGKCARRQQLARGSPCMEKSVCVLAAFVMNKSTSSSSTPPPPTCFCWVVTLPRGKGLGLRVEG